jgi:hypothetical protein
VPPVAGAYDGPFRSRFAVDSEVMVNARLPGPALRGAGDGVPHARYDHVMTRRCRNGRVFRSISVSGIHFKFSENTSRIRFKFVEKRRCAANLLFKRPC